MTRFLAGVIVCACLCAQPKPSQPTSSTDRKQNESGSDYNQASPGAPKPTATNPAPISQPHASNPEQEADSNRKIADYTEALARYTLALVFVGSFQLLALITQGIFLYKAFRETKTATSLTRDSLKEVMRANAINEAQSEESNTLTRTSVELTHESILLAHRPRLLIHGLFLNGPLNVESILEGQFAATNVGGTRANIIEYFITVQLYNALPMKPMYFGDVDVVRENISLAPGEERIFKFDRAHGALTPDDLRSLDHRMDQGPQMQSCYVFGFFKYTDDWASPVTRYTYFCRRLDRLQMRFEPVENPDYERAD